MLTIVSRAYWKYKKFKFMRINDFTDRLRGTATRWLAAPIQSDSR
ncbi:hypothetical protein [Burkholderia multivorans]|nr:hypothetical protein [Burkholderia multivorans]